MINKGLVIKIRDGHELKLQSPETMKIFGSKEKIIDKTNKGEIVSTLEVVEVALLQCNLVDNQCQKSLRY